MSISSINKIKAAMAAAALLLSATFAAPAVAQGGRVRVENFTKADVAALAQKILEDEALKELDRRGMAIFAAAHTFPELDLCHVSLGVTHPEPADERNPRIPKALYSFAERIGTGTVQECQTKALDPLFKYIAATGQPFVGSDDTLLTSEKGPARYKDVDLEIDWLNLTNEQRAMVFERLKRYESLNAFDLNGLTLRIQRQSYTNTSFPGASPVQCFAQAVLVPRAPADRTSRYVAGATYAQTREIGTHADCGIEAVFGVLDNLFSNPPSVLAKAFPYANEQGFVTPNMAQVEKRYQSLLAKTAARQKAEKAAQATQEAQATQQRQFARTTSVNTLSCTNQCVNGSCLRTFSNGRQERWQAPRNFNPLTNNWEWDTTTNACGG